ncbi:MAG: hypothetical protein JO222_00475, partial [Frankiales bacterium]|nr:hypothetical protein [Frankiales bacterium]
PQELARDVLAAIDNKKAMVVTPRNLRVLWRLQRLAPVASVELFGFAARREQRKRLAG